MALWTDPCTNWVPSTCADFEHELVLLDEPKGPVFNRFPTFGPNPDSHLEPDVRNRMYKDVVDLNTCAIQKRGRLIN